MSRLSRKQPKKFKNEGMGQPSFFLLLALSGILAIGRLIEGIEGKCRATRLCVLGQLKRHAIFQRQSPLFAERTKGNQPRAIPDFQTQTFWPRARSSWIPDPSFGTKIQYRGFLRSVHRPDDCLLFSTICQKEGFFHTGGRRMDRQPFQSDHFKRLYCTRRYSGFPHPDPGSRF